MTAEEELEVLERIHVAGLEAAHVYSLIVKAPEELVS